MSNFSSQPKPHRGSARLGLIQALAPFSMTRLLPLLALLALSACQAMAGKPTVAVVYSPSLDAVCSLIRGGTIRDEWATELSSRTAEFESLWADIGPALIETAEGITGKSFPPGRITARLTLCDFPSQSVAGISINMRYALRSFTSTPVPLRYKIDTLFHELLHRYFVEHPVKNSRLLSQFASESDRVKNHLHLLALQKAVLLARNESAHLHKVIEIDSQLPGGYYKRAWAIVNATDTEYLRFVDELSRERPN